MCNGRCIVVSLRRARERVLYENILKSTMSGAVPTQRMFFAEELKLSKEEYQLLECHATEFAALGFEIEYLADDTISVTDCLFNSGWYSYGLLSKHFWQSPY